MRYLSEVGLLCSVCLHHSCLYKGTCLTCVVCLTVYSGVLHDFTIGETWRVYYKWKELLNLREPMGSPWWVLRSVVLIVLYFFVLLCFVCLEKKTTHSTLSE